MPDRDPPNPARRILGAALKLAQEAFVALWLRLATCSHRRLCNQCPMPRAQPMRFGLSVAELSLAGQAMTIKSLCGRPQGLRHDGNMNPAERTRWICERARDSGFDLCGVAAVDANGVAISRTGTFAGVACAGIRGRDELSARSATGGPAAGARRGAKLDRRGDELQRAAAPINGIGKVRAAKTAEDEAIRRADGFRAMPGATITTKFCAKS